MKSAVRRRGIGLAAAGVFAVSSGLAAGTASAATVIGAPTVSSPLIWYTNTPYAFTFTGGSGATAVAFEYSINGASLVSVPATDDSAQVNLEFSGSYDTLEVYAVAADGTVSVADALTEQPVDNNVWAAADDVNGDGLPDLLTAGGAGTGLPSGIWQALGSGNGHLHAPATNLVDADTGEAASYFDGAQFVMGHFGQNGFEDVLAYSPAESYKSLLFIGSGNGSAFDNAGTTSVEASSWFADPITGDAPLQVTNGYDATGSGSGPGIEDGLFSIAGDATHGYALDYDEGDAIGFSPIQLSGQKTPDGTADWNEWKIAGGSVQSGVSLYLWNESTGALYLWEGIKVTDNGDETGTMTYTQYKVSCDWNKGVNLTTLEAANFDGSVTPGLWAVGTNAVAKAYVVSGLSTKHTATIKAVASAKLS
jgi:hypothetical protein